MKHLIFFATLMITCSHLSAQNVVSKSNRNTNPVITLPTPKGMAKGCKPAVSYNSASTALTVKFPATGGGKVEIYRNGAKVVNVNAAAGAMLSYTLRNYGRGNYTVLVSSRNTVVYCRSMNVK